MARSPASVLRSKGLIPKDWNLSRLTPGQKSWVTKQTERYRTTVLRRPDDYVARNVSGKTAKALKRAGYEVNNGKALILAKGQKVRIREKELTFSGYNGYKQRVLLMSRPDFLHQVERLRKLPFNPDRLYALKIGNSPRFKKAHPTLDELIHYSVEKDEAPIGEDEGGWHSEDARDHMSLVIIDKDTGEEYDVDPDTGEILNHD